MKVTDFTVGWVCALPIELAAATEMLDEKYGNVLETPLSQADTNIYTLGRIGVHHVVVACLPAGRTGTNSAAVVAAMMCNTFPALRFSLMVGIAGGVPSNQHDIRLGDIVISQPTGQHGGVVQYDLGKTVPNGKTIRTGSLKMPPIFLLEAVNKLHSNTLHGKTTIRQHLSTFSKSAQFASPGPHKDKLFTPQSKHVTGEGCAECSPDDLINREPRKTLDPVLFFGNIASGNQVMRDGAARDRISNELGGILCFEMEAAGLMDDFRCLAIRGICDYADSHKHKKWQPYAAAVAAACAKELLSIIP